MSDVLVQITEIEQNASLTFVFEAMSESVSEVPAALQEAVTAERCAQIFAELSDDGKTISEENAELLLPIVSEMVEEVGYGEDVTAICSRLLHVKGQYIALVSVLDTDEFEYEEEDEDEEEMS